MKNIHKNSRSAPSQAETAAAPDDYNLKPKFEIYGEEMIEKMVRQSGNSGRVYLPPEWVGKNVKIIRLD
jgi:putative transposon-encoded protein